MDEKEALMCQIKELKYRIEQYESQKFQFISKNEAVTEFLKDSTSEIYQVDTFNNSAVLIGYLRLDQLEESNKIFYIIRKAV